MVFTEARKNLLWTKTASCGKKTLAWRAMYAYEIMSDYLVEGFLIDLGRCYINCTTTYSPACSCQAESMGSGKEKLSPVPSPPKALQLRRNASPGE